MNNFISFLSVSRSPYTLFVCILEWNWRIDSNRNSRGKKIKLKNQSREQRNRDNRAIVCAPSSMETFIENKKNTINNYTSSNCFNLIDSSVDNHQTNKTINNPNNNSIFVNDFESNSLINLKNSRKSNNMSLNSSNNIDSNNNSSRSASIRNNESKKHDQIKSNKSHHGSSKSDKDKTPVSKSKYPISRLRRSEK